MKTERGAEGLRERKKRATRAALSEAAVRLAAERGAENVTVEAISSAAGVSPRTFFNYFESHYDAFVMTDPDISERVRRAVLDAPAALAPLDAVREALTAELSDIEARHELWNLRARVLERSPHLLARGLGAHAADERALAEAVAERLGEPVGERSTDDREPPTGELGLHPRLVAAVAVCAVRVAMETWCARPPGSDFPDILRTAFDQIAAGLAAPGAR